MSEYAANVIFTFIVSQIACPVIAYVLWVLEEKSMSDLIECKDCKRWVTILKRDVAEYGLCQKGTQLEATKRDDYCSYAERVENE